MDFYIKWSKKAKMLLNKEIEIEKKKKKENKPPYIVTLVLAGLQNL